MGLVEGREREVLTILEVCRGISIGRNSVLEGLRVRYLGDIHDEMRVTVD